MDLCEYQAKQFLRRQGFPVPRGTIVTRAEAADALSSGVPGPPWVIKAQIRAGGRGKAGGVRIVENRQALTAAVEALLDRPLVTAQTPAGGLTVRAVLIEECLFPERECYLAVAVDREAAATVVAFSEAGGVDIEEAAVSTPEQIRKTAVDPIMGLMPYQVRWLLSDLKAPLPAQAAAALKDLIPLTARLFKSADATLVELNPLAVLKDGGIAVLDARLTIDDNALYRQPRLRGLAAAGPAEGPPGEALRSGLSYVPLAGDIAIMANGAGLAMATMDLLQRFGATPANFLDLGGGAAEAAVEQGLQRILADRAVRCVLINIFGGITRCDAVARGIAAAVRRLDLRVPLVIRLEGHRRDEGLQVLAETRVKALITTDLERAARWAADIARGDTPAWPSG